MNWKEIAKTHKIKSVKAYDRVVLIHNEFGTPFSFHYKHKEVAKKVAYLLMQIRGV